MAQATARTGAQSNQPNPAPEPRSSTVAPFRYRFNVYFQDGLLTTALLAALLYLTLATSMDAAGHVTEGMGLVVTVTLGAVVLGALTSFSRFDGFFAMTHALFAGLALILFLMSRLPTDEQLAPFLDKGVPELQARAYYVLLQWLNWVDAALSGQANADNFVFILEISFLLWWMAFLGMWSILRYGYVWRAVVPAALVMVINAYYAPQSVTTLLGIFSVLALFLLIRTHLADQQLAWRDRRLATSHDISWGYLRTGITYTVIVLALAWLIPGLGRNPQMRQLLAPINEQWEETSQNLDRLYQGLNRRPEVARSSFGKSMTLGGPRHVTDNLVFNVRTKTGRYWRAVTYDTYTGTGWINSNTDQVSFPAYALAPIASWAARTPVTATITLMESTGNVVFGAPDIRQMDMDVSVVASAVPGTPMDAPSLGVGFPGAQQSDAVEFTMVHAGQTLDIGDHYTLLSNATTATQEQLNAAGTSYPPEILDRYVQLPQDFSPRVAGLAQSLTMTATTPFEKAKAIETYLRTIPYNDAIAAPPPGADPLEYFLFDVKEGYCDYYASAMAMMLRSLGLPARVASGYAEGMLSEESGLFYMTERDAHTWVEMFYPGLGWIEFEPTAGESPLERPENDETAATVTQPPAPPPGDSDAAPPPDAGDSADPQLPLEETSPGQNFLPWWVWAILTPLLLILGVALLWRLRVASPSAFTPDLPILLFERLQRWAARIGLAPEPHQTPYEQAQRWSRSLPEGRESISHLTHSYVEHRFGGKPWIPQPADTEEASAESQAWQTLEPLLWKQWLRKWIPWRRFRRPDPYELKKRVE